VKVDERAPGLVLGERVRIGEGVHFGAHVVVHSDTELADGCIVEDHAVLGKRPRLASHSTASGDTRTLKIGERATVGAGAVVFAAAEVGEGAILGDQCYVRERVRVGAGTVIGRGSVVENDVSVGARVRVQTGVYLTAYSVIEDDVFLGPGVITTNDDTMSRHAPRISLRGSLLRRACRVGAGVVLTPGVEIGEEAFVGAGALVTRDVPAQMVALGVPARVVCEVPDEDLLERWR